VKILILYGQIELRRHPLYLLMSIAKAIPSTHPNIAPADQHPRLRAELFSISTTQIAENAPEHVQTTSNAPRNEYGMQKHSSNRLDSQ
jgi:hypothetical protein